jgi:putative transposase
MQGKRFSEEQMIRSLHDAETSGNVRDVCRQHNIAEQTLYRWQRQWGGDGGLCGAASTGAAA